jgi:hypothetical protein
MSKKQVSMPKSEEDYDARLAAYDARKGFTKKEALKLRPGDIVQVKWDYREDTVAMLVERLTRDGFDFRVFNGVDLTYIDYDQVVAHFDHFDLPKI